MSLMIPELSEAQLNDLPSRAEAKVYRALRDRLPSDYVVLFQVGWILRREEEQARDGETDFLICHPDHGYLCIEVKGGGIGFEASTGQWFSVDRNKDKHPIKNPITQALKAKYSIRSKLNEHPRWRDLGLGNVVRGHTVFFPDVGDALALSRPDMPAVLIGSARALEDPYSWIKAAFAYWGDDAGRFTAIGRRGIDVVREIFARSFSVDPLVASRLAEQEARRLVLTKDQLRVLDFLRAHRRVAVSGGAGTGKTVLALEKARRLASEGFKTLLTCYNRQLADHLSSLSAGTSNLDVMSFHQLCYRQVEEAEKASGRGLVAEAKLTYPGKGLYDVQLPNALAYSLEVLPDRYDAIVCDEGQDFREEFWVPLELLLSDYERAPLYVFYDDNQNIYARAGTFPIRDEPFTLTTNCRNTAPIHRAAYKHYKGVPVGPPDIDGDDVQFEVSPGRDSQARKIHSRIVDLVARQGVSAGDITVLIADARRKSDYYDALKGFPLPKPAGWLEEGCRGSDEILIDTIQRFKGLESPIVILWGLDTVDWARNAELIYVGMSRAKSLVVVVGTAATCAAFRE
ncbi:DEAD/DEAH box helicase [Thioalkalivibrio sp. ALMg13-2]|uniref:DEAD/DEAH box helicase n=1 Tax=Thioalkalivibrio sp. ALMg13-2 TaxID=1158167 RepID=UPI0003A00B52|nr:nuclease-related domain-containing DEAD/DEAH box helicase [Thioalkalivibrio sp. ALMg13-2]